MDAAWKKSMKFTSGTGVVYKPNILVEQDVDRAAKLASELTIGSVRLFSWDRKATISSSLSTDSTS